ncbi:MAG: ATP-dependent Clp protease adaptor ClpS [Candidatus Sericytochromatia bacterium]|nr:ATP-dependent Clp protease adaptor ClpS [Candidatus Sericytochromatia bacterium]
MPVVPEPLSRPVVARYPHTRVLLHDDDVHEMGQVVRYLLEAVPSLGRERCVAIMLEAHQVGRAVVVEAPFEHAEGYAERLQVRGLTATLEPVA